MTRGGACPLSVFIDTAAGAGPARQTACVRADRCGPSHVSGQVVARECRLTGQCGLCCQIALAGRVRVLTHVAVRIRRRPASSGPVTVAVTVPVTVRASAAERSVRVVTVAGVVRSVRIATATTAAQTHRSGGSAASVLARR
jgi:hypothetical protein